MTVYCTLAAKRMLAFEEQSHDVCELLGCWIVPSRREVAAIAPRGLVEGDLALERVLRGIKA